MVNAITISCNYCTLLIGGEHRPFPAPAAPVVQYRVGLWAQHRAKHVHRVDESTRVKSIQSQVNLQLRSGGS